MSLRFLASFFEEDPGVGSMARLMMFIFGICVCFILLRVEHRLVGLTDPNILSVWLEHFPVLTGALISLVAAPYAINKGSSVLSDFAATIKKEEK